MSSQYNVNHKIAVIGLCYVGLHLTAMLGTICLALRFDINQKRIADILTI